MNNFCYLKDSAKSMKSQATTGKKYLQNPCLTKDYIQNKPKSYNNPIKRGQGKTLNRRFTKEIHIQVADRGSV